MIDMVVHRHELRPTLARLCRILTKSPVLEAPKPVAQVSEAAPVIPAPEAAPAAAPHA
jgi:acetyl-CoA carboxylase carboxyl transferase subunit beta